MRVRPISAALLPVPGEALPGTIDPCLSVASNKNPTPSKLCYASPHAPENRFRRTVRMGRQALQKTPAPLRPQKLGEFFSRAEFVQDLLLKFRLRLQFGLPAPRNHQTISTIMAKRAKGMNSPRIAGTAFRGAGPPKPKRPASAPAALHLEWLAANPARRSAESPSHSPKSWLSSWSLLPFLISIAITLEKGRRLTGSTARMNFAIHALGMEGR